MKIKSVKIQNFRSIKNETLIFPENGLISIIWPNNAWKSNFLRAIDLVLWENWNNWDKLEDYDYYCWDRNKQILIEINFTDWKKVIFVMKCKRRFSLYLFICRKKYFKRYSFYKMVFNVKNI